MVWKQPEENTNPVYVIEAIPVAGDHKLEADEIRRERIPTPPHLRLSREIARGGAGRIHAALDRNLLRHVALKRLDGELARVPMYREGFVAEAQITGQLQHPNVVPVHELALEDDVPYFTMKLVQGVSFAEWLADPSRPVGSSERLEEGLEILIKVCDALAYAHARGVIHRDLKPANVMVGDFGQVYLLDWGLARLTRTRPASGERAQMAAPGPVGTITHCAPEQARGNPEEMDERSEVFGVGALLYQLVSGKTPYGRCRSLDEAIDKASRGKVIPLEQAAPDLAIPTMLRGVVMRAVAPQPEQRHPSILDLQRDLRRFLHGGLHLPTRSFEAGATIIAEGDCGDEAFLLVRGHCTVQRDRDGEARTIGALGPGDVFGEMALLLDEPRGATVVADEPVTVTVLDRRTMEQGLGASAWTNALVQSLAKRFDDLDKRVRGSGSRTGGDRYGAA